MGMLGRFHHMENIIDIMEIYGYGSIPIDTFLVGWTSIYQLFWGSLGTRVLIHPHMIGEYHWFNMILITMTLITMIYWDYLAIWRAWYPSNKPLLIPIKVYQPSTFGLLYVVYDIVTKYGEPCKLNISVAYLGKRC
jgi:hypothetical protein